MSKATRPVKRVDPEKLREAIEKSGETPHLLTIGKVREIAERSGLLGEDFRSNAYLLAAHVALRQALRHVPEDLDVPLFYNMKIEEQHPDGTTTSIQGYKHAEHLTREEWDAVIFDRVSATIADQVTCNRIVRLRNRYARERGWTRIKLPFPDVADKQGAE